MSILAPNHYLLNSTGNNPLNIEYWSAQNKLTISSPPETFTGSQITASNTPIGQLISVVTGSDPQSEKILGFLIPVISLQDGSQDVSFQTIGVTDRHTNPNSQSYGPVHDTYSEFALSGVANIV